MLKNYSIFIAIFLLFIQNVYYEDHYYYECYHWFGYWPLGLYLTAAYTRMATERNSSEKWRNKNVRHKKWNFFLRLIAIENWNPKNSFASMAGKDCRRIEQSWKHRSNQINIGSMEIRASFYLFSYSQYKLTLSFAV